MKTPHALTAVTIAAFSLVCGSLVSRVELGSAAAGEAALDSASAASSPAPQAERARQFKESIAPLLARRCLECHGPTSKKGRLNLSRKDTALAGGENGPAIVPGKADESLLWQYVDADEMPKNGPPLSDREKRLLREWIDAGAIWSIDMIEPPAESDLRADSNWLRRLTVSEYIETVRSAVGVDIERDARRLLPPDLRADGFSNTAYNLNVDLGHVEAYARLAETIVGRMDVPAFAARFSKSRELNEKSLRELISGMGQWLLRGPLDEHEVAAFLSIATTVRKEGGDFDEAVRYVIEAMLQSPRFIYRVEKQRGDGTPRRLDDYELASRLSYILWGGPPDSELMRAADAGELSDRRRIEAQVRRMLQDPRAVEKSSQFIREWLNLDHLANLRPDQDRFPSWSDELAADMRDETLAFFKHVVWEQNRPLADLMNAQVTFVTPRLADHYGLNRQPAAQAIAAAPSADPRAAPAVQRVTSGLQALYTFDEGRGRTVHDTSGAGEPLHLEIADPPAVRWNDEGLTVNRSTLIAGERPPKRLIDAVKKSGAVTLEAWVTPASASQSGPARIVTLSTSVLARNFTLGQDGDKYDVRFRTTKTDASGLPSLSSPGGALQTRPTHVVYTRNRAGRAKLYVDGSEVAARNVGDDLSNWDGGFRLGLANEMSKDRTWLGTFHLVAVYDRALSAEEVQQNQTAGARKGGAPALAAQTDLQALYVFDEGSGATVHDTSGAGPPLDLKIENTSAVEWDKGRLTVNAPTLITSAQPPKRLIEAARKSKALTLEAWITPGDTGQSGPARILTLSSGTGQRNFTLGQEGDKYDVRLRTTKTDQNGMPSRSTPRGTARIRPTHVVYTRDATGRARLYIDGEQRAAGNVNGDLSNWDGDFRLALANETTSDRPWRGTFHRIAVYTRALTAEEVRARGPGLSQYDLADVPGRGGLLTQGSVLTIGGDEASMVTRGLFVLHNVLDGTVEDPPPCVDTTPVPTKPGLSQRAVAEARLANQACGGCHATFEPLAFGLEKFNGLGAWHERDEHGNRLREDGEILIPGQDRPVQYRTAAQLMDILAGSDQVRRTITRKVTQFALGRPLTEADAPVLDRIHATAQEGGGTWVSLITAIVMSDLVQTTGTER